MSITARLTVAEYDRMLVAGVFDQGRRVEFIEGEIREMTPIGPEHETVVDRFTRWSYRNVDDASVLIRVQLSESSRHRAPRSCSRGLRNGSNLRL